MVQPAPTPAVIVRVFEVTFPQPRSATQVLTHYRTPLHLPANKHLAATSAGTAAVFVLAPEDASTRRMGGKGPHEEKR